MKTVFTLVTALMLCNTLLAQQLPQAQANLSYQDYMDRLFGDLIKTDAESFENGIFYDRIYPLSSIGHLTDSNRRLSRSDFFQA